MGVGVVIIATALFGCVLAVVPQWKANRNLVATIVISASGALFASCVIAPDLYADWEALPRLLVMISAPILTAALIGAGLKKLILRKEEKL